MFKKQKNNFKMLDFRHLFCFKKRVIFPKFNKTLFIKQLQHSNTNKPITEQSFGASAKKRQTLAPFRLLIQFVRNYSSGRANPITAPARVC